jgi:hypothetical protein
MREIIELKLGLHLWSVRFSLEKNLTGTLEKIAEIGYKDLQVNSSKNTPAGMVYGKDVKAADLRNQLDRFGLRTPSVHFQPTGDMVLEAVIDDLQALGRFDRLRHLVLVRPPGGDRLDQAVQPDRRSAQKGRHPAVLPQPLP